MKTFKEFLKQRDAELYNEITWQGIKSAGKKAIGTAALLAGLGAGSAAYAPSEHPVDFKFSPNRETLVQTQKAANSVHNPNDSYQIDSGTKLTTGSKDDFSDAIRSASTTDKDNISAVHHNTDLRTSYNDLTSILPKDIKDYMNRANLSDNILSANEKEILNKNVNSLTNDDKQVLRNLSKKLSMHHHVTSPKGSSYLTGGHFGYESNPKVSSHISGSPEEIYNLNKLK